MSGQAETTAPEEGSLDDLASFLSDTPEEESEEAKTEETGEADKSTADGDTDEVADDQQADADSEEDPEEPKTDRKIKVTVKSDDGSETTQEVPETELVAGYQRQADYTRKTQALAERENQAVELFTTKYQEIRQESAKQIELARDLIAQVAGIRSDQEMAQLAATDPAAWVQENQRKQTVINILNQLEQQANGEKTKADQAREQRETQAVQSAFQRTWAELSKDGIDKPKLAKIYGDAHAKYGFTADELGKVYDPRIVRMMKDATAYQELLSKKGEVTKKAIAAPKFPSKPATPAQERKQQELSHKFKSGRAKLNDLVSYLN